MDRIFERRASGARAAPPAPGPIGPDSSKLWPTSEDGDVLIIWKLDRLNRLMAHLVQTVTGLEKRGAGLRSLTKQIDSTTAWGES